MPGKTKSSKPTACAACHGTDLVRQIATYPVLLTGQLAGKQIHVGRVALYECQTCGHLMPTPGRTGEGGPERRNGNPPLSRPVALTRRGVRMLAGSSRSFAKTLIILLAVPLLGGRRDLA